MRLGASPATSPSCPHYSRRGARVIVSVLVQILLAIVGVIGAYIAWRQWRTAQDKAKLDRFEDRRKAYEKLREAVAPVSGSGKVRMEDCDAFAQAMHDMHFLFNK